VNHPLCGLQGKQFLANAHQVKIEPMDGQPVQPYLLYAKNAKDRQNLMAHLFLGVHNILMVLETDKSSDRRFVCHQF